MKRSDEYSQFRLKFPKVLLISSFLLAFFLNLSIVLYQLNIGESYASEIKVETKELNYNQVSIKFISFMAENIRDAFILKS